MYFEIAKKICWVAVSAVVTLVGQNAFTFDEQSSHLLSSDSTITVDLGTVPSNSKPTFSFSVKNDLGTPWSLVKVAPSCTQSPPSVVSVRRSKRQKISMSVSSGEEVWFDKGVDVALLRDGNEEIETIEFIVVRVKPNTAVLLLEISAMETSNLPRMIKQSNKVKGWTYSIPIVIQE